MAGYTYLQSLIPDPNWQKFATALAIGGIMIAAGSRLAARIASSKGMESCVIPAEKPSLFGVVDLAIDQWVKFQDSILGKENRKYAPFTASLFFFLLICNLVGLIPGMPAVTTTVWINVGLAIVVFGYFNWVGIKEHGLIAYLKHFAGPVWALAWLIFPLEVFSTCLRILTLNLRLYWNISADHIVLGVFTELVPFGIPVLFYALGTFVAFMQAFIFSLLTMLYIQLASSHEEDH
jgi:F-type H+-transporting ATPase subunit a